MTPFFVSSVFFGIGATIRIQCLPYEVFFLLELLAVKRQKSLFLVYCAVSVVVMPSPAVQYDWFGWHWGLGRFPYIKV